MDGVSGEIKSDKITSILLQATCLRSYLINQLPTGETGGYVKSAFLKKKNSDRIRRGVLIPLNAPLAGIVKGV